MSARILFKQVLLLLLMAKSAPTNYESNLASNFNRPNSLWLLNVMGMFNVSNPYNKRFKQRYQNTVRRTQYLICVMLAANLLYQQ